MKFLRLIAIDPSITCTGWAMFNLKNSKIIGVGKIKPLGAKLPLAERLRDLDQKVEELLNTLKISESDIIICEAPTTMKDPAAAIKVEQVRCIFENRARVLKSMVPGRINPRSVHYEVLGLKGKQLERIYVKALAVSTVQKIYGEALKKIGFDISDKSLKKHQDIVDALLIGHLAVTRVNSALAAGVALPEYFESLQLSKRRRNLNFRF